MSRRRAAAERLPGLSISRVERTHTQIIQTISKYAMVAPEFADIVPLQLRGDWRLVNQDVVKLELSSSGGAREFAIVRSGKAQVFRLRAYENVWISWYEKLVNHRDRTYSFDGISICVWVGEEGIASKTSVLRAEWDHSNAIDGVNSAFQGTDAVHAAQPHWHVDVAVGLAPRSVPSDPNSAQLEATIEQAGLTEIGEIDRTSPTVNLTRCHLGMRAEWRDSAKKGWQSALRENPDQLPQWADLCLEYINSELRREPEAAKPRELSPFA